LCHLASLADHEQSRRLFPEHFADLAARFLGQKIGSAIGRTVRVSRRPHCLQSSGPSPHLDETAHRRDRSKPRSMSPTELASLQAARRALAVLPPHGAPAPLRAALRALDRAADDAEAAADEAGAADADALAGAVEEARVAADSARAAAKSAARADVRAGRRHLLFEGADVGREEGGAVAAKVAEDITAGLRRVTGIVQEELDRTVASGDVRLWGESFARVAGRCVLTTFLSL
jgi:hypothetical protein